MLKENMNVPPLWVLCDAKDNEKLACLGTHLLPAGQGVQSDVILETLVTSVGKKIECNLFKK